MNRQNIRTLLVRAGTLLRGTRDIAFDRDRTARLLRESEARRRAILETAIDSIVAIDVHGRIIEFNPAAGQTFGWRRDEIIGRPMADTIVPPSLRNAHRQAFARHLTTGQSRLLGRRVETTGRRSDGTEFPIELTVVRIDAGTEASFTAYIRDISERKATERLQEQLAQSQKIETVGRLAGGIAHDFNNILTAILGYSHELLAEMPNGDPRRAGVEEIRTAAERAAALTRQLLAFSRKQILQPISMNLNAAVHDVSSLVKRLIGENIEIVLTLDPQTSPILADPSQIEQIIVNLAVNARDAMPDGGKLTIATSDVVLDEEFARTHLGAKPGPHVRLAVTDTGVGMSPSVMAHIFEPFFTTKPRDKGTGLGLATVYGIVKQSGGTIWVESEEGRGATFTVYLPPSSQPVTRGRSELALQG